MTAATESISPAEPVGFGARLVMFFLLPWRVLFDATAAGRVRAALDGGAPQLSPVGPADDASPAPAKAADAVVVGPHDGAVQLLGILQRDGRLVDFLTEDVASFSDADVGAAARAVHEGCSKSVRQYFELQPVRTEDEESKITVEPGFDPRAVRLVGNVSGEPPFAGTLTHAGWRAVAVRLPDLDDPSDIVQPAEVEL